jgi:hypothetical protein
LLGHDKSLLAQLRVVSTEDFPALRRVRLELRGISGDAVLILRSSPGELALEGIEMNGRTRREQSPVALFSSEPTAGWQSKGSLVRSRFRGRKTVLDTPAGQFSGVDEYEVEFAGLPKSVWFFKLGFGVAGYDVPGASARLMIHEFSSPAPAPTREPAPCPPAGVDANPVAIGGDFSSEGLRKQVAEMRDAGAAFFNLPAAWADLEPERGVFQFSELRQKLAWVEELGLDTALTLKTVDTTVRRTPPDLAETAWDDPEMLARFGALLDALAGELGSRVKWINLGNEVNVYFSANPDELTAFSRFYRHGAERLELLKPELQIGLVFAFDVLRLDDLEFNALSEPLDQVSYTYYGSQNAVVQRRTSVVQRDAAEVALDFADMRSAAKGKPVLLTEVGHSSSNFIGSSETRQAEFYAAAAEQLRLGSGWLTAANFFLLSDLHPSILRQFSQYYFGGQAGPFIAWLGSLGTKDLFGRPKPANAELLEILKNSRRPDSCQAVGPFLRLE